MRVSSGLLQAVSASVPDKSFVIRTSQDVAAAAKRLHSSHRLFRTPIMESYALNKLLGGHRIFFKCENLQRTGAFKARGALNTLLQWKEESRLPPRVVAYSSGNHAQAVAWASQVLKIPCTIFMPKNVSPLKAQATRAYGAEVVLSDTRPESEALARAAVLAGAGLIPPFDLDSVICGQGTAVWEALVDMNTYQRTLPDAVFTPVGGGGLFSGSLLAAKGFSALFEAEARMYPARSQLARGSPLVFGAEPLSGNDANQSVRTKKVVALPTQPISMADGAMTLAVTERTLHYLLQGDGLFEITEAELAYWTQWMTHLLKLTVEPTSALSLAAAVRHLQAQKTQQTVLVCLFFYFLLIYF